MLELSEVLGFGALIMASLSMIYTAMHYRINMKPSLAIIPFDISVSLMTGGGRPSLGALYEKDKDRYRIQMRSVHLTTVLLNVGAYSLYNVEIRFMRSKTNILKKHIQQSDGEKIQIPSSEKKIFKREFDASFDMYTNTPMFYAIHVTATHHFTKSEIFYQIRTNKQIIETRNLEYT